MAMAFDAKTEENQPLETFLTKIMRSSTLTLEATIKKTGELVKAEIESRLAGLRRQGKLPKKRDKHMHQDVVMRRRKKDNVIQVSGGRQTGTLWHIVNDGTYRTHATHFIDFSLNKLDREVDNLWVDKELK